MIAGEGMPRYRNPTQKGNLIVKFEIDFPNKNFLSEAEMKVGIC
jgi:DnaJ family protein A protein 2